ncbi:TetR/AcrR family transcriptional regulator [Patulibacter brassicae]|jgi:AcrR family transcriptional regulator|uniref:TetR/AcrR family transcriptional regulator n=1 Tax=Patulibacter brassicae TaxID=1705717 RepID=A0ABU4VKK3_9ACTN|nr:TetR/AcrR family transcriptional regulator [Patulibacter brassicae]MDX8152379.1 TetR/AcrR family transcriptional regulator [Patulibacter brassicae]
MVLRIRDALERLLADGTAYTELGVDRIVAEAGIPRSTFYVYFSDRSEMLRAIFHESWASLGAATRPWWELEGPVARADVHRVLDGLVRSYRPHTPLMSAVHDAAAYDPAVRELVEGLIADSVEQATGHLLRGQREGFVNPALPPRQAAAWIVHMWERSMHRFVRDVPDAELEAAIDAVVELVWQALYAPAAAPRA